MILWHLRSGTKTDIEVRNIDPYSENIVAFLILF